MVKVKTAAAALTVEVDSVAAERVLAEGVATGLIKEEKVVQILKTAGMGGKEIQELLRVISKTGCFVAGTLFLTPDGEKAVEQFRPGDQILSRPENDVNAPPGGPDRRGSVRQRGPGA